MFATSWWLHYLASSCTESEMTCVMSWMRKQGLLGTAIPSLAPMIYMSISIFISNKQYDGIRHFSPS